MPAGLLIRLRPNGPWRIGPDSGARDRVGRLYHSDSLYAAVCSAMGALGMLDDWLDATARAPRPAVRIGSCFPYQGGTLFVTPPRHLWPPPASSKVRWKGARFVPVSVVESLLAGEALAEDRWMVDGPSQCLLPAYAPPAGGPFRVAVRSNAAVDRRSEGVAPHSTACLEFTADSGLWTLVEFAGAAEAERWTAPVTGAFRLLADSGFGGERSRGWGRSGMPEITAGEVAELLLPRRRQPDSPSGSESGNGAYWLLSLYHPAAGDAVDWRRGDYELTTRGGRVESAAGWGAGKRLTRLVSEGSVLVAPAAPDGAAPDVAPEGFPHPVYRAGFAVTIPVPLQVTPARPAPVPEGAIEDEPIEEPVVEQPPAGATPASEPVLEEPSTAEPVIETPVPEESVVEASRIEEPMSDAPAAEEPAGEPTHGAPDTEEPIGAGPASEAPANEDQPGAEEPPATEPGAGQATGPRDSPKPEEGSVE